LNITVLWHVREDTVKEKIRFNFTIVE